MPPHPLHVAIVNYLQQEQGKLEDAEGIEVARQCLAEAFGLGSESEEQLRNYTTPFSLPDIFEAGVRALAVKAQPGQSSSASAGPSEATSSGGTAPSSSGAVPSDETEKFEKFVEFCKKKGFFGDLTPGTPAYAERMKMAEAKYQGYRDGSESVAAESGESQNELLKKFITMLSSKGFFNGTTVGSPEYQERYAKAVEQFQKKLGAPSTAVSSGVAAITAEQKKAQAEQRKAKGNDFLANKQYREAVSEYTAAVELQPDNAVYRANRAAAYSYLNEHKKAIEDCSAAVKINPAYTKAWSRMGTAYFSDGQFDKSVDAFAKASELEPGNPTYAESLVQAQRRVDEKSAMAAAGQAAGLPGGFDLSALGPLLGEIGGGGGGSGGGGGTDQLANMLNNPMFVSMAEQMMQSGALEQIMKDPSMMQMASQLNANPEMINSMLSQQIPMADTSTELPSPSGANQPPPSSPDDAPQ